ncbi:uncharacterized protein BYT42DRAFT_612539 [Radiomyces spectabilis]|uniref:uncharacterized protein n=1 Tax=Radiomyces spectabilis TaxID=64574 RepID=UPI00221E72AF|nr:uncharacterized protein BYT42DRAFT_612539 [Radiomyces spectabilis]KAI8384872.1 hypothetical protein BYT42DRAFT_612539 [Radiomyces spectabilis]
MSVQYTVGDLIPKIQANIDSMEYPVALAFCQRALELEPTNAEILEVTGQVEIELDMFAEARNHLLEAIRLKPDQGYSKYMYLGQLSVEKEAIEAFQKGVELMTAEKAQLQDPVEIKLLSSKIAGALCSMTEIYLTDCCFEPEAESKCEEFLQHAQQVDPENPEVYQLLASVRLSQLRNEDASAALETSMRLWIDKEPGDAAMPIYDSRLALVKLLLELTMFQQAFAVLEGLQKENDQVVDLWYLYGWTYYCLGDDEEKSNEERMAHWEDARDCLELAVKLYNTIGSDDEAMVEHAHELIATINQVVPPSAPEEEEVVDEEIEFVSDDEDDAMEM